MKPNTSQLEEVNFIFSEGDSFRRHLVSNLSIQLHTFLFILYKFDYEYLQKINIIFINLF